MATSDKQGKAGAGRLPAVPAVYRPHTSGRSVQAKPAIPSRGAAAPPVFKAQGSQRSSARRPRAGRPIQAKKLTGTIQMTRCPNCSQADLVADEFCMKCGYNVRDEIRRGGHQMTIMPGYPGGNVPVNEITHVGNKPVK